MDPITLSILFGSAALAGAGITRAMNEPEPGDMVIRKVFNTSDGWMVTELLSPYTLDLTGQILDMNLNGLWPKIESGFFRVMVLALPGGDLKKQVLLVLQSAGQYGWFLSEAYCPGYRRVQGRLAYQRVEALLGFLNTDPADVVVNHAMSLTDLNARYNYLKFAISANPQLAALLSMSDDFKTITRETVKVVDPATYARVETQRRGQIRQLNTPSSFHNLDRNEPRLESPTEMSTSWSYRKGDRVMLMGSYGPGGLVYAETSSDHRHGTVIEIIADMVRVAPDDEPMRSAMWPKTLMRPLEEPTDANEPTGGPQNDARDRMLTQQVLRAVAQIPGPRAQFEYLEGIDEKYPGALDRVYSLRAKYNQLESMVHPERALAR